MGTVIKANGEGRLKRRLEAFALNDHMSEAHRVVREARAHAAGIVRDAQVEIERQREEERRRGHADGYKEGAEAGRSDGHAQAYADAMAKFNAEQESLLASLADAARSFDQRADELHERARHDILALALAVAGEVTHRTAAIDRQAAVENAKSAVALLTGDDDIVLRINPADAGAMRTYAAALAESLGSRTHVRLVEDTAVGPGGCIVDTPHSRIDASIETQLREATALILRDEPATAASTRSEHP